VPCAPAGFIFNLQFFDFPVERREAQPKDIRSANLVHPGLCQSKLDVTFLIKFDGIDCRASSGPAFVWSGKSPRRDPIAIAEYYRSFQNAVELPDITFPRQRHKNPHGRVIETPV
jgi:hypothetical protein